MFDPSTLFDFGSGVGSVTWAAHQVWGDAIKEFHNVDISSEMNTVARLLLQGVYHCYAVDFVISSRVAYR